MIEHIFAIAFAGFMILKTIIDYIIVAGLKSSSELFSRTEGRPVLNSGALNFLLFQPKHSEQIAYVYAKLIMRLFERESTKYCIKTCRKTQQEVGQKLTENPDFQYDVFCNHIPDRNSGVDEYLC